MYNLKHKSPYTETIRQLIVKFNYVLTSYIISFNSRNFSNLYILTYFIYSLKCYHVILIKALS